MDKFKPYQQSSIILSLAFLLYIFVSGCSLQEKTNRISQAVTPQQQKIETKSKERLPLQNKKLVVLVTNSPYSYAIVEGAPVGLEYELLNLFAQDNQLELQVKVIAGKDNLLDSLQAGNGDIAAASFHTIDQNKEGIAYTHPLLTTDLRLIHRNSTQAVDSPSSTTPVSFTESRKRGRAKKLLLNNLSFVKDSLIAYASKHRIVFSLEEAADSLSQETLIEMVAAGKIEYAVAEKNVAEAMSATYTNIDYATSLVNSLPVTWAVHTKSLGMQEALNQWILKRKGTLEYNMIINKYTRLSKVEKKAIKNQFLQAKSNSISQYDNLLKSYAADWDWRLLAALVYQESRFDPQAKSGAGAIGLMQVLPATAKWLGNQPAYLKSPEANIHAGMEYLQWLKSRWQEIILDEQELIKFTLASYNVGFGHVRDAYMLAKKYNLDPQKWEDNVERMLLAKSDVKFYQDPAVQYGYCRGKEPVEYVHNILHYYQHYQNIL